MAGVFDMSKIQIYKQITTHDQRAADQEPVYLICQRYKFISKSQHTALALPNERSQRDKLAHTIVWAK